MVNSIEAVAKSFGHSVEFIKSNGERDLIAEILDPNNHYALDYDDVMFALSCKNLLTAEEPFDPFVSLAYEASIKPRTPDEIRKIRKAMMHLASDVLSFNCSQSDEQPDETLAVFYEAA